MKFRLLWDTILTWLIFVNPSLATRLIESKSLSACMENSAVTASSFQTVFFPGNQTVALAFEGTSQVSSNVTLEVQIFGYGHNVLSWKFDPCSQPGLRGICPMKASNLPLLNSNFQIPKSEVKKIPDIVYRIPDIDAVVRLWVNETETTKPLACLEARLSNGRTVRHCAVPWILGFLCLFGLTTSAVLFDRGYLFAPSKMAANMVLLLQYYQSLGQLGMIPFETPPLVGAWTQNFQWSMGIIRISFLQSFCRWYQRATGGKPSTLLSTVTFSSVELYRRSNAEAYTANLKAQSVCGTERVALSSGIETTNLFVSVLVWFFVSVILLSSVMICLKFIYSRFDHRQWHQPLHWCGPLWLSYYKGSLYRLGIIWFVPLTTLCGWEIFRQDSNIIRALAILILADVSFTFIYAGFRVVKIARTSRTLRGNHAFLLFGDEKTYSKWGFLFSEYKSCCAYFLVARLAYLWLKGLFTGTSQQWPVVSVVASFILDLAYFMVSFIFRPYLDFTLNFLAISVVFLTLLNSAFMLLFSNLFDIPALATGICGIGFFLVNALFLIVVLFLTTWSFVGSLLSKNADLSYNRVRDDRSSFTRPHMLVEVGELEALGVTARGTQMKTLDAAFSGRSMIETATKSSAIQHKVEKPPRYQVDWVPGR